MSRGSIEQRMAEDSLPLFDQARQAEQEGRVDDWAEEHAEELGDLGQIIALQIIAHLGGYEGLTLNEVQAYELALQDKVEARGSPVLSILWQGSLEDDLTLLRFGGHAAWHGGGKMRATAFGWATLHACRHEIRKWTGLDDFSVLRGDLLREETTSRKNQPN